MIEWLNELDTALFLFLNVKLANPVTNFLMPIVTSNNVLRICYGIALILLLWKGDARLRWLVLFSAVTLTISDQLSSHSLKPFFERPRPCHVMEELNLLVSCGAGFAMPSSHATNAFGQMVLFGFLVPKSRWFLFGTAFLIAISRIFVGVHYPGDIIIGALVGAAIGIIFVLLYKLFEEKVIYRAV